MFKGTSYLRELCLSTTRVFILGLLGLSVVSTFSLVLFGNNQALAVTSSTVNYQARLLQSNGAIAPDGNYNVDFKLFSTLSTGGGQAVGTCTSTGGYTCLWEENYTGANVITVKDGYLTANLGSITSFPSTINWGNQLYLTMNIGGTGTPSWDGEMTPRIQLTSVPYAFQANSALTATTLLTTAAGYTDILQLTSPSTASNTITVPDATGTVCLQSSISCGFAPTTGGNYLAKNNSDTSTASYLGNLYAFTNTNTGAAGVLALNNSGTNSDISVIQSGTSEPSSGQALILANNNTTTPSGNLIDLQNKGVSEFHVDVNGSVTSSTINSQTISSAASFTGTLNVATGFQVAGAATTGNYLRGNGTNFISSAIQAADIPAGSSYYIQNQNAGVQTSSNFDISGNGEAATLTAGYASVTGGVAAFNGNVGIGTSSPTSPLTVNGNIALLPANSIITGSTGLTLQETGDVYGTVSLSLQNRTGMNGALFSNPSLDLVDFAFDPSSGVQQNIRYEHRSGSTFGTGNTGGEFQIGTAASPNLVIGAGTTAIKTGNFGVGTVSPSALLSVGSTSQFQVSSAGAVTAVGVNAGTGLLQGSGGLTLTGTTAINTTGTSNTSIGNGTGTLALVSSGLNVTVAGAVTGVTTLVTSSTINSQTISSAASFTGTLNVATGFQVAGAATTGNYLRGNGTNFISSAIQAADIPAGSSYYIQNQNAGVQTSSNFDISGNGQAAAFDASSAGVLNIGTTTATSLQLGSSTNTTSGVVISTAGNFALNGVAGSTYAVGAATTTGSITIGGTAQTGSLVLRSDNISQTITGNATTPSDVIQTAANSTTAFQVDNSSSSNVLDVDTTNQRVGIDTPTPAFTLDVNGSLHSANFILGSDLSIEPIAGSQSAVTSWWGLQLVGNKQNSVVYTPTAYGTSGQYGVIIPIQQAASVGVMIQAAASQSGNIFQVQNSSAAILDTINSTGNISIAGGDSYTGAGAVTLSSAAANALTITGNAASTFSTTAGTLTIQSGSGTVSLGSSTILSASGALSVESTGANNLTLIGDNAILSSGTSAGNVTLETNNASSIIIAQSLTNSTTAFQVENSSAVSVVTVDTTNDKIILNSTVSGTSALQFAQLNSSSAASSNFSQLLGVDSSGNVGLSTAGVALTSPALAYWDGLNNPTVTGQSYPLATITGAHTAYSSANGVQLTDTSTTTENGSINWNFSQVPFEEIQYQFKAGGGTGADSTWFYGYADSTPTTEYGTGFTKGYLIYFSEYHGCIGIAYGGFTDGNQCGSGGGANPLASVAMANIGNNAWHNVDIQIKYNVITVRWDGVSVLTYSDIYTRDLSALNFGFGSRTGGQTNYHYIKGLVVTKLGNLAGDFGIDSVSPIIGALNWDSSNNYLGVNVAAPSATIDVAGTSLFTGSTSTTGFQVQNASSVDILTVDTSNGRVVVGGGSSGTVGDLLVLDTKNTSGDPTEVNGAMYYNSNTGNFRCGEVGTWVNCVGGLLASNSAISTVNNCTTNCAAFTPHASLAANYCTPGRVINISMEGVYSTTTAINIGLGVYWGTNAAKGSDTLVGFGSSYTFTSATTSINLPWTLKYQINCLTSTTAIGEGIANFGSSTSAITPQWMDTSSATTVTTTSAENIYVFPQFATAATGDTISAGTISITGQ